MLHNNLRKIKGSTLVIAVFTIITFAILSFTLNHLQVENSDTFVYSSMNERSELAAESALEIAILKLYPLGVHKADPNNCSETTNYINEISQLEGLEHCNATVACYMRNAKVDLNVGSVYTELTHYYLDIVATCEVGQIGTDQYLRVSTNLHSELVDGD